jgi:PHP family Zn ribbon phosphoesterase
MDTTISRELISSQLVRIGAELREMRLVANLSAIDPNILADFRSAVDHARSTAWAVQQCLVTHNDESGVHEILVRERIRRVMELCQILTQSLSAPHDKTEPAATALLYDAAKSLCDFLEKKSAQA